MQLPPQQNWVVLSQQCVPPQQTSGAEHGALTSGQGTLDGVALARVTKPSGAVTDARSAPPATAPPRRSTARRVTRPSDRPRAASSNQ
jgi:hypothetical protein